MKIRLMRANSQCGQCMFFSVSMKMWAKSKFCKGYCCYPCRSRKDKQKQCEFFIPNP